MPNAKLVHKNETVVFAAITVVSLHHSVQQNPPLTEIVVVGTALGEYTWQQHVYRPNVPACDVLVVEGGYHPGVTMLPVAKCLPEQVVLRGLVARAAANGSSVVAVP